MIPYLRHGIYIKYDPFNESLYFSEDCEKLGMDNMNGYCISNINAEVFNIDVANLEKMIKRSGDETGRWKYRGHKRDAAADHD